MKRFFLLAIFVALPLGAYGAYQFWQHSLASALAVQKTKHLSKVSQLKRTHAKDVAQLKQKHRRDIAKVKAKARAKAKVQRAVAAVPIMGIAAFGVFEKLEFDEWKKDNPRGTFEEYANEISQDVNDLLAEEYSDYSEDYEKLLELWQRELD